MFLQKPQLTVSDPVRVYEIDAVLSSLNPRYHMELINFWLDVRLDLTNKEDCDQITTSS
jgi:hypothetical protein